LFRVETGRLQSTDKPAVSNKQPDAPLGYPSLVRFGMYFFLQAPPGRSQVDVIREELDQMVLAEELGFDSVWLTEHHYSDYGLSSAPSVLLATLAARTTRIRLGIAVYVLPFHHPLRIAEETATLDILSGGRLTVGLGRGNRPLEFYGHAVPQQESRTRMEEGIDLLLQAWTQDAVTYSGAHWNITNVPVYPRPLTRPHPPVAFAVTSQASLTWAASRGFAILSSGLTTPLSTSLSQREVYRAALEQHGHGDGAIAELLARWVLTKHVYVAPTDAEAEADAEGPEMWYQNSFIRSIRADGIQGLHESVYRESEDAVRRMSSVNWPDLVRGPLLIGSPETVAAKLLALQDAGVGEIACWMNFGGLPIERVRRSMLLFAHEVMPHFRSVPSVQLI
jgi:alkanesulfonate monooxygenase SsuD/methylene tetrahydromethanopterin reductase-like flavin-dependent oxidoreductase (luciferase family)